MKSPEQKRFPDPPSPEWMDARVEAYLDGDLPPREATAFEHGLSKRPRWQHAVRRARKVQNGLRMLPRRTCPPDVTRTVLRDVHNTSRPRLAADRAPRPAMRSTDARTEAPARWWQPPLAMGVLLAVVLIAAVLGRPSASEAPSERFTQAQIEHATAEAEWTLAYLSRVARKTGTTVQEDVLEARVAAPVRKAVAPAFESNAEHSLPASSKTSDK